jgi:hypothetical protein
MMFFFSLRSTFLFDLCEKISKVKRERERNGGREVNNEREDEREREREIE